jgi:hypothetical protein
MLQQPASPLKNPMPHKLVLVPLPPTVLLLPTKHMEERSKERNQQRVLYPMRIHNHESRVGHLCPIWIYFQSG